MAAGVKAQVGHAESGSYFHMGGETLKIPFAMHRRHRERLCAALKGKCDPGSFVVVQGGSEISKYDTDTNWDFKQESNFQWLYGVKEPGCVAALDVDSGRSFLFVPHFPKEYQTWMGEIKPKTWFKTTYEVDEVVFVDDVAETLAAAGAKKIVVINGTNRDSGISSEPLQPKFEGIERFTIRDDGLLWDTLNELRVIKDSDEIEIMQFTNDVSSRAHIQVMRTCQGGDVMEYINEATFKYHSFLKGCARVGYPCICPAGPRNATLHYGHPAAPNDVLAKPAELRLNDMGAEYHCYTADVTVTWPQTGKFTPEQKTVYDAVWAATTAVEEKCRPGQCWVELHFLSLRVMLQKLTEAGLFRGDVEEMMKANLGASFMPHGLGHMLGLDVHDVGGYKPGDSKKRLADAKPYPVTVNLRCGRALEEGHCITVEPGFYFVDYLIDEALADEKLSSFINRERLEQLRPVGGVRIEDNLIITQNGCRVLTNVPRETGDIEAVIAGTEWTGKCRVYEA